jgi:hypothetical protein
VEQTAVAVTAMTTASVTTARMTTAAVHVSADLQVADMNRGADASGVAGARAEHGQGQDRGEQGFHPVSRFPRSAAGKSPTAIS